MDRVGAPHPGDVRRALRFGDVVEAPPGADVACGVGRRFGAPGEPGSVHLPLPAEEERLPVSPDGLRPVRQVGIVGAACDARRSDSIAVHVQQRDRSPAAAQLQGRSLEGLVPWRRLPEVDDRRRLARVLREAVPGHAAPGSVAEAAAVDVPVHPRPPVDLWPGPAGCEFGLGRARGPDRAARACQQDKQAERDGEGVEVSSRTGIQHAAPAVGLSRRSRLDRT